MASSHGLFLNRFSADGRYTNEAWPLSGTAAAEPPSRDVESGSGRLARAEAEAQAAIDRLERRERPGARASSASSSGRRAPPSPARAAENAMLQRAADFLSSSGVDRETKKIFGAAPFARFQPGGGGCECIICLQEITRSEFTEGSSIYITPCAGRHVLHRACAEEWFVKKDACPMCREVIPEIHQPRMPAKRPSRRGSSAPQRKASNVPKYGTEAHKQRANERGASENLSKIMRSLELGRRTSKRK